MPDISIVIPIYNESKNINALYTRLTKSVSLITKSYELVFVNDGSHDNSLDLLLSLRKKDKKVKVITFTRNFGHMAAISAGLSNVKGEEIVVMDADLQDPPEMIPKLHKKFIEGYEIVYAIKGKRDEGFIKNSMFKIYYQILKRISKLKMPEGAGTFSIISNTTAKYIVSLPERSKYFSGLRIWTGLKHTGVKYDRPKRQKGKSKSIFSLITLALNGMFSFSYLPLRLASFLGFFFGSVSFLLIIVAVIARFVFNQGIAGWASTIISILFIGSVQLITLGIIGEYLAKIYDEVKGRPEYIISKKFGIR